MVEAGVGYRVAFSRGTNTIEFHHDVTGLHEREEDMYASLYTNAYMVEELEMSLIRHIICTVV